MLTATLRIAVVKFSEIDGERKETACAAYEEKKLKTKQKKEIMRRKSAKNLTSCMSLCHGHISDIDNIINNKIPVFNLL